MSRSLILISSVKDVTATYSKAKGKHGAKETSEELYSKAVKKKFVSIVGTPKWADLDAKKIRDEDSDEEYFRVRVVCRILRVFVSTARNVKKQALSNLLKQNF